MSSLLKRLILTFTAVPALFSLIYFLPYYTHVAFAILVVIAVMIGGYEMTHMLSEQGQRPLLPFWVGGLLPIAQYVQSVFFPTYPVVSTTLVTLLTIAFAIEIITGAKDEFSFTIERYGKTTLVLFYPSYVSIFLIKVLLLEHPSLMLLLLFLCVFGNDTFAYVFGMWLGRNNCNVVAVSPNKSIAGFIGGSVMSMVIAYLFITFIPTMAHTFNWWQALSIGLVTSIAGNIGDLIESTIKRGVNVKDSGTIILGRGGILDSIDSLLLIAPIFYVMIILFS
ncbi:MAG: phosphatidate cytidylyltransferase [Sphaerochaetaceae bacterium]|jgi:phosphatidate cytidylyltransferase